jgi:UDP-N-acetylglucosamine 3-dehydrogenase
VTKVPELKAGVVGLRFGANHARILRGLDGVRLVAVCDIDAARLQDAAAVDGVATFRDYRAMLRDVRLDAVIIAVPARLHEEVALAAIASGCNLLVEKPLAPCLQDGIRIVKAAKKADVTLMPGHLERFNPALQELARRLRAGEAGDVHHFAARRMGPLVVRSQDVNVVHDSALHDIDAMRYLLGSETERVYAEGRRDLDMPFEDGIAAVLRFEAAGQGSTVPTATLDANWLAPGRIRDLSVRGSEGTFFLDYLAQTLSYQRNGAAVAEMIAVEPQEPLLAELTAFVRCIRNREPPPIGSRDALAALAVCDAITESARSGKPVVPAVVE